MTAQKNETVDISFKQLFTVIFQAALMALTLFSIVYMSLHSIQKELEDPKKEQTQQQKDEEHKRMLTAIILMAG